jgi:hypothetical protein
MLGGAVELAMNLAVTHFRIPSIPIVATVRRTFCSGGLPAFAPIIPDRRYAASEMTNAQ